MKTKRISSIVIDFFIISFVGLIIFLVMDYILNINNKYYDILQFIWMTFLFCIKDLPFKNASIGKRIMKLEIKSKDNESPNTLTLVLRNITIIIWPLK